MPMPKLNTPSDISRSTCMVKRAKPTLARSRMLRRYSKHRNGNKRQATVRSTSPPTTRGGDFGSPATIAASARFMGRGLAAVRHGFSFEQRARALDRLTQGVEEPRRRRAVHHAVVEGQAERQHVAWDDAIADGGR